MSESDPRQYESLIKRQRQEHIADELSMEVRSQYMDEIVEHMGAMEVRYLDVVGLLHHANVCRNKLSRM